GVTPAVGHDLTAADAAPRGGQVALISHDLWMRRFGGAQSVLSKSMTLDGKLYSVAGVLPNGFEFPGTNGVGLLVAMTEPSTQPGGPTYFLQCHWAPQRRDHRRASGFGSCAHQPASPICVPAEVQPRASQRANACRKPPGPDGWECSSCA